MTNREWLDTLSDEDFANAISKEEIVYCKGECCTWAGGTDYDLTCPTCLCAWLKEEHKTTSNEDLVAEGWVRMHDTDNMVRYKKALYEGKPCKVLLVSAEECKYFTETGGGLFYDKEIDFLRKCAEKIRKEKGWCK